MPSGVSPARTVASGLTLVRTAAARLAATLRAGRAVVVRVGPGLSFVAVLLCWVVAALDRTFRTVTEFPGFEGDGPFQLFNPLRRIAAGQAGGVEFQYFHGIAFPYLHYPIFALAGKDVFAAELSRYLVNMVVVLGTTLAVSAAVTRRLTATLALSAITLVLTDQLSLYSILTPGNGSVAVRCATPFLIFGVLAAGFRPRVEAAVVGALAGAGLLLGVEHGIAAVVMLGFVWAVRCAVGLPGGTLRWAATAAAVFAATAGGCLLLIGGSSGAASVLRFSLLEVPHDQFWYFGVPPNKFLFGWDQVVTDRGLMTRAVGPVLLVGLAAVVRARVSPSDRPGAVAALGLLAYGLVTTATYFGYSSPHYLEPATRAALTAGLALGYWTWVGWARAGAGGDSLRRGVRWGLAGGVCVFLAVGPTAIEPSSLLDVPAELRSIASGAAAVRDGRCRMAPNIQVELDTLVAAIDQHRATTGTTRPPVIWSTYAGRLEAHYGVFHPYCDYAIHALGPDRRAGYVHRFRESRPDYVVTCLPSAYGYEQWLQNGSAEFYEEVVLNYRVLGFNDRFALWARDGAEWRTPEPSAGRLTKDPEGPDWFTVPVPPGATPVQPRVVEVEYEVRNPLAGVPVLGNMPRHLLGPTDCLNKTAVSLPPYRNTWSFIVYPTAGKTPALYGKTFSLVGGRLTITRVHVRPLGATPQQVDALTR